MAVSASVAIDGGAPVAVASRPLGLLDELCAPYAIGGAPAAPGWGSLGPAGGEGAFHWRIAPPDPPQLHTVWGITLCAAVAPDHEAQALTRGLPGAWAPAEPVERDGTRVGSVWRSDRGGVLIPFDPTAAIDALRAERYRGGPSGGAGRRGRAARSAYYVVRPLVPRRAQLAARRRLSRVRAHRPFPHWPWEPALHDLADRLAGEVAGALGAPLPCLAPWPAGRTWALVLTHDVETAVGRDAIERVRAVERAAGLRSSWNLVPERYRVPDELVERLRGEDCEVGVHGLRHDGRDLGSLQELERRLPEMQRWGRRWGASGFRSPATLRRWEWMPLLGFDYDSSSPDTDPFEPIPGGCCSWLPFFNRDLVELPITLPQDHALLEILRCGTAVWHEKTARLRARGGMALLITHPDYLLGDAELDAYRSFLTGHAGDPDVWHALPGEVSAWWRRRAASRLVRGDGGWRVEGPAAGEAAIAHVGPPAPTA